MYLPLANLLHHKLRSALSAVGIGIGICMLVTLSGLSRGSLYEIADRWEAVDAELFAYPEIWGGHITSLSGVGLPDSYGRRLREIHPELLQRAVPVFLWHVQLMDQGQTVAGVDPGDWPVLTGGRPLVEGRLFDPAGAFAGWLEEQLLTEAHEDEPEPLVITPADLADPDHNGMEIVIDSRLAGAEGLVVGQTVEMAHHSFRIVGIVPAGGIARIYMPRRTAQFLFGSGDITKSTLLFLKLRPGVDPAAAARQLHSVGLEVVQLRQFRGMLENQFGIMFTYVDAVNAFTLVIAFLFIMITLYTLVLQRRRDIAILKSSGASDGFIIRQVLAESMLLTGVGTGVGIGLSFLAGWLVMMLRPLLTVQITWPWIVLSALVAVVGAFVSAAYPAWQATRVDMVEALAWE